MQSGAKTTMNRLRHAMMRAVAFVLVVVLLGMHAPVAARADANGTVRVKLTRLGTPSSMEFSANCNYVLSADVKMNIPAGSSVQVSASGGKLILKTCGVQVNCGSNAKLLRCSGGNSGIQFRSPALSNVFCGDLYLSASGASITSILHIYIEDYLYGVVAYEMSNSYPLEALKAQAVAARNYVLKKMASRASKSYHVTDTTSDQVFKGYNSSYGRVIQAVNETAGHALYAGSSLASCYYSASNGGQTESTKNAWGSSLSYSTVKDDPYDLENASARKKTAVIARNGQGLEDELKNALLANREGMEIVSVDSIIACDPRYASPSRLYKTLKFSYTLRGPQGKVQAEAEIPTYGALEDWYGLSLNSSANETVTVSRDDENFYVIFRRWGHGIGMSQRGAQTMAATYGKSHRQILEFYYPGTSLANLSLSEAGAHSALQVSGEKIGTVELASAVKLYAAADENSGVRALLSPGVKLDIYDANENWAAVAVLGLTGFVSAAEMEGLPALSPEPTVSATPEPTATITPEPTASATPEPMPTNTPEPTATLPALEMPTAQPVATITPEPTATATPEPMPTNTPEPTATLPVLEMPTAQPVATITPEPTATATPEPTPEPQPTVMDEPMPTPAPAPDGAEGMLVANETLHAYVNVSGGSSLTLRRAPDTSSAAVGHLRRGVRVQMLAFDDDWAYVRTDSGLAGFAARQYLYIPGNSAGSQPVVEDTPIEDDENDSPADDDADTESGEEPQEFHEVDTGITICNIRARTRTSAAVYKSYSTSSECLGTLPASTRVTVTAYNKKWAYIQVGSRKGFVLLKYLKAE